MESENIKEVNFKERRTSYLGRNGPGHCIGLDLYFLTYDDKLLITPINSKNKQARCDISIPGDDLQDMIDKLQELKKFRDEAVTK
jgi:hypothetical protein